MKQCHDSNASLRFLRRSAKPFRAAIIGFGFGLALSSCRATGNDTAPPPKLPDPGPDGSYEAALPKPPERETRTIQLELGADLKRCDVEDPHFFYDKSVVRPQAVPEMKRLAACLMTEPFSDVRVRLVGRADPRGSTSYNQDLSRRRAEYVKDMLIDYGVPSDRVEVAARGESGAIGDTPDASYGYDRRVDIVQLYVIHP